MKKFLITLLIDQGVISHINESIVCGPHKGIVADDLLSFINGMSERIKNKVRTSFMEAGDSNEEVRALWGQLTSGYAKHLNNLVHV